MSETIYVIVIKINLGKVSSPFVLNCIGKRQISIGLSQNIYFIIAENPYNVSSEFVEIIYNLPFRYASKYFFSTIEISNLKEWNFNDPKSKKS